MGVNLTCFLQLFPKVAKEDRKKMKKVKRYFHSASNAGSIFKFGQIFGKLFNLENAQNGQF